MVIALRISTQHCVKSWWLCYRCPSAHPTALSPVPGHAQGTAPTSTHRAEGRLSLQRAWKASSLCPWTKHWGTETKCSSGRIIRDLDDPNPTRVSSAFLPAWKTWEECFEFHSPTSQGVDGSTKRNCCAMRGQGSEWITALANSLAWTGLSEGMLLWEKYPLGMILECIALSARVWRSCTLQWEDGSGVSRGWGDAGETTPFTCSSLTKCPHHAQKPNWSLHKPLLLTLHFQSRGLGTSPNP